jgi:hypothetical protein
MRTYVPCHEHDLEGKELSESVLSAMVNEDQPHLFT